MLSTVIDYEVLLNFTRNQPEQIPKGTEEENEYWNSFWAFMKMGSNLIITNLPTLNYSVPENYFLRSLTTGRKGSSFKSEISFNKPHKCKFPKDQNVQTVFFLNEQSESEKAKYRKNNGFLFGFMNDYPKIWKKLSLHGKDKNLPVSKSENINFKSWAQLSDYILPFSDLIIIDNYMLDEKKWKNNLLKIIDEFSNKSSVKFNLLLVSFLHSTDINSYQDKVSKIKDLLKGVNCNLSIILSKELIKVHDRDIFTNYLWINSGSSLNYFNNDGNLDIDTKIFFNSLVKKDNMNTSKAALSSIKTIIERLQKLPDKDKRLFGDLKNKLLN